MWGRGELFWGVVGFIWGKQESHSEPYNFMWGKVKFAWGKVKLLKIHAIQSLFCVSPLLFVVAPRDPPGVSSFFLVSLIAFDLAHININSSYIQKKVGPIEFMVAPLISMSTPSDFDLAPKQFVVAPNEFVDAPKQFLDTPFDTKYNLFSKYNANLTCSCCNRSSRYDI